MANSETAKLINTIKKFFIFFSTAFSINTKKRDNIKNKKKQEARNKRLFLFFYENSLPKFKVRNIYQNFHYKLDTLLHNQFPCLYEFHGRNYKNLLKLV